MRASRSGKNRWVELVQEPFGGKRSSGREPTAEAAKKRRSGPQAEERRFIRRKDIAGVGSRYSVVGSGYALEGRLGLWTIDYRLSTTDCFPVHHADRIGRPPRGR